MIKEKIVEFLCTTHNLSSDEFDDSTSLFSSGILDSFSMIDLVAYIEQEANIRFGVLDMHLGNLDSVEKILQFIAVKQGA